jgi:hypothetical protein
MSLILFATVTVIHEDQFTTRSGTMVFQRDSNLLTKCLSHCNIVTVHEVLYAHSCSRIISCDNVSVCTSRVLDVYDDVSRCHAFLLTFRSQFLVLTRHD